jgi:RecA-family ATPase
MIGGEPKTYKSFLALDMAVSVASGTPFLRRFPVHQTGPVLFFPAEDSLAIVVRRLQGICAAAGVCFKSLAVEVITAPVLRLDTDVDRSRLMKTVESIRPILLILDPMIRLHRIQESDSMQISELLSHLRVMQREFHMAIALVHHFRKDSNRSRPGQALRGSGDLHAWGDSNLYLRRHHSQSILTVEQRAAREEESILVQLIESGPALSLNAVVDTPIADPVDASPLQRVLRALDGLDGPASIERIRQISGLKTSTACSIVAALREQGVVVRDGRGFRLAPKAA